MAAIDDLIAQIEDPALRGRIAEEVGRLAKQKKFGLVFEEHLPEVTPLYEVPLKKRGAVAVRPEDMYLMLLRTSPPLSQNKDLVSIGSSI